MVNDAYDFSQNPPDPKPVAEILPTEKEAAKSTGYVPVPHDINGKVSAYPAEITNAHYGKRPNTTVHEFRPGQKSMIQTYSGKFLLTCSENGEMELYRLADQS